MHNRERTERAPHALWRATTPCNKAAHMAALSMIRHIWLTIVSFCLDSATNADSSFHTLVEHICG